MKNGIIVEVDFEEKDSSKVTAWLKSHVNDNNIIELCVNVREVSTKTKMIVIYKTIKTQTAQANPRLYAAYKNLRSLGSKIQLKIRKLEEAKEMLRVDGKDINISSMHVVMHNPAAGMA